MTLDAGVRGLPERIHLAATGNFRMWHLRLAQAAGGNVARHPGAVTVTGFSPAGKVVIPFPRWSEGNADGELDAIVDACRAATPLRAVECSLAPRPEPADLAARLAARARPRRIAHFVARQRSGQPTVAPAAP